MKKFALILLCLLTIHSSLFSQTESEIDSQIIQGKLLLKNLIVNWQESEMLKARAHFERLSINYQNNWLINYYIGLTDSRLVSYYFANNDKDKALNYIDDGIEHLKKSIDANNEFAESHSLISSLYGNKIAVKPLLGMILGPKSGSEMGKAMNIAQDNPRNYLIAGWSAFYTPKMFGGGKEKAKEHLEKAIACFENFKYDNPTYPDWGHEEVYAWLGMTHLELGNYDLAQENYDKALEINPNYSWINYVLKPHLEKTIAEKKN